MASNKKILKTRIRLYAAIIALSALLFIFPLLSSWHHQDSLIRGIESSYFLQHQQLSSDNPGSIILSLITSLTSSMNQNLLPLIPLTLGISCIILFCFLIRKQFDSIPLEIISTILLITTPTILSLFTTLSITSLYLFAILLSLSLLQTKNTFGRIVAIILLLLTTQITLPLALTTLVIVTMYAIKQEEKKEQRFYLILVGTMGLTTIVSSLLSILPVRNPAIVEPSAFSNFIFDLNGIAGISLFLLILAIVGIVQFFKEKKGLSYLFALGGFIGIYLFDHTLLTPLVIVFVLFASHGVFFLYKKQWKIEQLKQMTLLLLGLGLIFTLISYQQTTNPLAPQTQDREALQWIDEHTPPESIIFSSPEYEYAIRSIAHRTPYTTIHSLERQNVTDAIFHARYIDDLFPLLDATNSSYIFLPESITQNFPPDEQFLFLLHNERFKMVFQANDTTVWMYESKPELSKREEEN